MTLLELLNLILLTSGLTFALIVFSRRLRLRLKRYFEHYLPPRYLKARGVRRRPPASPSQSKPDEPV